MGCKDCDNKNYVDGICDVHRILENDIKTRKVKYCKTCNAYICGYCQDNYMRRIKAYLSQ